MSTPRWDNKPFIHFGKKMENNVVGLLIGIFLMKIWALYEAQLVFDAKNLPDNFFMITIFNNNYKFIDKSILINKESHSSIESFKLSYNTYIL